MHLENNVFLLVSNGNAGILKKNKATNILNEKLTVGVS